MTLPSIISNTDGIEAADYDHHHPVTAVLRVDGVRGGRADGVGCYWDHMDVFVSVHGCALSAMGEPGCVDDDWAGNC